jgi:DNA-binding winged helix-turn-helix (wHTH) protein/pimeloyl-ACP methyl ester carboxylesterase
MILAWDDCELDMSAYELRRAGRRCHLEPQVFDLLAYLVHHRGRLVAKDELIEHIWPERYVSEAALSSRLMTARKVIGDSGSAQRRILTVKGRGFRFVGDVQELTDASETREPVASEPAKAAPVQEPSPAISTTRYVRTTDGVNIAFASYGGGPGLPVLMLTTPLESHLSLRFSLPWERLGRWSERLCENRLLVMFDPRSAGLSDRGVEDTSLEARLGDIDAVIEKLRLDRFALHAEGTTCLLAIEYAARNPEKVALLMLLGPVTTSAQFWSADSRMTALRGLAEVDWRLFTDIWSRHGIGWNHNRASVWAEHEPGRTSGADATEFAHYLRQCQRHQDWLCSLEARDDLDLRHRLDELRARVVLLAAADWSPAFLETARTLAARLPNAGLMFFGFWGQMDAAIAALRAYDAEQEDARKC